MQCTSHCRRQATVRGRLEQSSSISLCIDVVKSAEILQVTSIRCQTLHRDTLVSATLSSGAGLMVSYVAQIVCCLFSQACAQKRCNHGEWRLQSVCNQSKKQACAISRVSVLGCRNPNADQTIWFHEAIAFLILQRHHQVGWGCHCECRCVCRST